MKRLADNLKRLEDEHRLRTLKPSSGIDLTSNDYLGFASHPELLHVLQTWQGPVGAGASRLLSSRHPAHQTLEYFAAKFFKTPKALAFSSGFQANHAIFSALPERQDVVIYDSLIHASVRAGLKASNATAHKFRHNDLNDCEEMLKRARGKAEYLWLAVESLYSMDGDIAPLAELYALCEKYDAYMIVDEAHATGIFGRSGRGITEGMKHDRMITLHTGGKALGVAGGLVCGSAEIIDTLVNKAPTFIYSTAMMPVQAALMLRALQLVDEEPERRKRLLQLCAYMDSDTQIIPVIIGSDKAAMDAAETMQRAGFDIRAIRPPTVPEGTARLRLSLNVNLSEATLERLKSHLNQISKAAT